MDNRTTGNFIRERRREKQMTQKQLADRLHVTDRAVSKWERGLSAPDISLLEPLAEALDVTIVELLTGQRKAEAAELPVELAVKRVIEYSEMTTAQTVRQLIRRVAGALLGVVLAAGLLLVTLNSLVIGEGFGWQCIPACLGACKAARAIETGEEAAIRETIAHSEGMAAALADLEAQGVIIRRAEANCWQTRLDDMFLWLEVDLYVEYQGITCRFECRGTYREGKVEFMELVNTGSGQEYLPWMLQLNDALSTYDPG